MLLPVINILIFTLINEITRRRRRRRGAYQAEMMRGIRALVATHRARVSRRREPLRVAQHSRARLKACFTRVGPMPSTRTSGAKPLRLELARSRVRPGVRASAAARPPTEALSILCLTSAIHQSS